MRVDQLILHFRSPAVVVKCLGLIKRFLLT